MLTLRLIYSTNAKQFPVSGISEQDWQDLFSEQGPPLGHLEERANPSTVPFQNRAHRFQYALLLFPEYRDIPVANTLCEQNI